MRNFGEDAKVLPIQLEIRLISGLEVALFPGRIEDG